MFNQPVWRSLREELSRASLAYEDGSVRMMKRVTTNESQ
jgi:hypothetical protein